MIAQLTQNTTSTNDTRECWVTRNGRQIKRRWSEMTETERRLQEQADERQAYVAAFSIY